MLRGTLVHSWPPKASMGLSAETMVPVRSPAELKTSRTSPSLRVMTPVPLAATPPPALTDLPVLEGERVTVVPSCLATTA